MVSPSAGVLEASALPFCSWGGGDGIRTPGVGTFAFSAKKSLKASSASAVAQQMHLGRVSVVTCIPLLTRRFLSSIWEFLFSLWRISP